MIIPSIDLMGGRAVQLRRGAEKILEAPEDPRDLARRFAFYGEVAVVDLDAALGRGSNRALVQELCRLAPCRVGGGVRTEEDIVGLIKAGATRVIIGTAATPELLRRVPRDWIMVALDARAGRTVDSGWRRDTSETPIERARRLHDLCSGFLFTQVEVEGTLEGVPLEPVRALRAATPLPLTIAGGIGGVEDIRAIEALGCDAQIGMALYTGRIDLDRAAVDVLDWSRAPLPTVVRDRDGCLLMLGFSSRESLAAALLERRGVYWSRSRRTLWRKGETSGHTQRLVAVRHDCDADALLFTVEQAGPACHTGRAGCFGGEAPGFGVDRLRRIIAGRRAAGGAGSYTAALLADPGRARAKVIEEAAEACEARGRRDQVWEFADLLYHTLVLMEAEGIALGEVESELRGRHR